MKKQFGALLLLAAMAGCSKSDQDNSTATPGAPAPAATPGMTTTNTPSMPAAGATPSMSTDTGMPATTQSAMDKMKSMGNSASDNMKDMSSNMSDQAQKYLDQINQYTNDKKYDLADSTMAKLQAMKNQLPAAVQAKIDSAQTMLDNAKKG